MPKSKSSIIHQGLLKPMGYKKKGPKISERSIDELVHSITVESPSVRIWGDTEIEALWRFCITECAEELSYDGSLPTVYVDVNDLDEEAAKEALVEATRGLLERLDGLDTVEKILAAYERGDLTKEQAFGPDSKWQTFHLGCCLLHVGRKDEARLHLEEIVARGGHRRSFERRRKNIARKLIAENFPE